MDLKEQDILGDAIGDHWYYRSKLAALLRWTEGLHAREALDVGAGSGFFSRALLERTGVASATCVDPGYDRDSEETVAGKPLRFRRQVEASPSDLVLLMDVLEHVDDDAGLLRTYAEMAPAGAHFVLTVPAFQWLWSGHDIFLEHRRRYRLTEIEDVARQAGLQVVRGAYFFGAVFPIAAGMRLADNAVRRLQRRRLDPKCGMRRHGALSNTLLGGACTLELPVFPLNRFAGLTAFVLARRL